MMNKIKEVALKGYIGARVKMEEFFKNEKGEIHATNILIMILIAIMIGGLVFVFMKDQTPQILGKLLAKFTTIFNL